MHRIILILWVLGVPAAAQAQLKDPTTYAPAVVFYLAARQDWATSQIFFQHGWVERNHRFTTTGRASDTPLSYQQGMTKIRWYTAELAARSAVHNLTIRLVEHTLLEKYPHRRKLIRTLGWVERSLVASYLTHRTSTAHFRQARLNRQLAREIFPAP